MVRTDTLQSGALCLSLNLCAVSFFTSKTATVEFNKQINKEKIDVWRSKRSLVTH